MPEFPLPSSGGIADGASCTRMLTFPSGSLTCAHHGSSAPWHTPPGCSLRAATLCQVCLRAVVPVRGRFSWTFLCETCTRIEATLAEPFAAVALTPHVGQSDAQRSTLFGRLHPDDVYQLEVRQVEGRGLGSRTSDVLRGPDPLLRLFAHGTSELERLGAGEPFEDMSVETFLGRFPASPQASAAAYLRYAEGQHPWLLVLIPDLVDLERLTAVADGTAG